MNALATAVAGPLGYVPALLAIALLVDHELVHEHRVDGALPTGRRLDIRALVTAAVVVVAVGLLVLRLLALIR